MSRPVEISTTPEFGPALRRWRMIRRLSQLELALRAGVSARHLCFLEVGRARPSRAMVLTLADALDVPVAERNGLLEAAGFARGYCARPAQDAALGPPLAAIEWMLQRHAPYPGLALDRHWRLQQLNPPAQTLLAAVGMGIGDSFLDALAPPSRLQALIVNWPEVARYMTGRLRTELEHYGEDPVLAAGLERLMATAPRQIDTVGPQPAVVPFVLQLGPTRLSFISTLAHFGGADDIALNDLRIELMFPADAGTKALLEAAVPTPPAL